MRTHAVRISLGSLLLLAACSAPSDPAASSHPVAKSDGIIGGSVDTTHQAVMALIVNFGQSFAECTGTVFKVDPDGTGWMITAAHCVLGDGSTPNPTASQMTVQQGNNYNSPTKTYKVSAFTRHPNYQQGQASSPYDFAVVKFGGASASTPTIPLTDSPDGLATGATIQIYGYGMTFYGDQNNSQRRTVTKTIAALDTQKIHHNDQSTGTCEGDSGGPSIVMQNGHEAVVGITSYGASGCAGDSVAGRLSLVLSWVSGIAGGTTGGGTGGGTGAGGSGAAGSGTGTGAGGGTVVSCSDQSGNIGCCAGGSVTFCDNTGTIQTQSCAGKPCGWDPNNGYYDCGFTGTDPSGMWPLTCAGSGSGTGAGGTGAGTGTGGTGAGAAPGTGGTGTGTGAGAGPGAGGTGTGTGAGAGPGTGGTGTGTGGSGTGTGTGTGGASSGAGVGGGAATGLGGGTAGPVGTGGALNGAAGSGTGTVAGAGAGAGNGAGAATGAGASSASDPSTDDGTGNSNTSSKGGCNASGAPVDGAWLAMLALPLLRRRRRRLSALLGPGGCRPARAAILHFDVALSCFVDRSRAARRLRRGVSLASSAQLGARRQRHGARTRAVGAWRRHGGSSARRPRARRRRRSLDDRRRRPRHRLRP
jgi:hypothetical protein